MPEEYRHYHKATFVLVTKIVDIPHTIENETSKDREVHWQIETFAHKRMAIVGLKEVSTK